MSQKEKWNAIYADRQSPSAPAAVLTENGHLLPDSGDALDIACGLGSNSLFLAERGLAVTAWDISDIATDRLNATAAGRNLDVSAEAIDITPAVFRDLTFDLVLNCHYLDRSIVEPMKQAIGRGGLIVFQTFCADKPPGAPGPGNPAYLLQKDELLQMCNNLEVLTYRDAGSSDDAEDPLAGRAYIIARKS